jgi:hypothetical protein
VAAVLLLGALQSGWMLWRKPGWRAGDPTARATDDSGDRFSPSRAVRNVTHSYLVRPSSLAAFRLAAFAFIAAVSLYQLLYWPLGRLAVFYTCWSWWAALPLSSWAAQRPPGQPGPIPQLARTRRAGRSRRWLQAAYFLCAAATHLLERLAEGRANLPTARHAAGGAAGPGRLQPGALGTGRAAAAQQPQEPQLPAGEGRPAAEEPWGSGPEASTATGAWLLAPATPEPSS